MEETKLDKYAARIFSLTERFSNNITKLSSATSVKLTIYLGLIQLSIGFIQLVLLFSSYQELLHSKLILGMKLLGSFSAIFLGTLFLRIILKRISDLDLKILQFTKKFYSEEIIKLCFEPMIADWKTEYTEAAKQSSKISTYKINLRYIYAFLCVIIQQSWIGKAFEIIRNLIK